MPNVSNAIRAEFARGDGRVKQKEDDRRKLIQPSDTLFVVNFHEETTKREDLKMLFEPFGELIRIDMKRNYAFVQFRTIEEATRAKEEVNGGKLDQSVLTVEYVARQRHHDDRRSRGGGRRGDRRDGRDYRDRDYRDRDYRDRGGYDRRSRRSPDRRRSPPRYRRSRSRSPPRYRSRSPPRRGDYYDDRRSYDDRDYGRGDVRGDGRGDGRGDVRGAGRGYRP